MHIILVLLYIILTTFQYEWKKTNYELIYADNDSIKLWIRVSNSMKEKTVIYPNQ